MRRSVACSSLAAGGQNSSPPVTRTRQVEHRARPPHMAACGRWKLRLASSTDQPRGTRTIRPGYDIETRRLRRRSIRFRISRAMKAAPMMEKYQLRRLSFHCAIANRCAALSGLKYSSAAAAAAGLVASSFPMAMKPRAASTGSSSAAEKSTNRNCRYHERRLNAKCRPRQPCSHPGAIRPNCQPCDPVAHRLETTRV